MKYHILFSGKNKKNVTNLSTAELAQRVVKVKHHHMTQDCENMVAITYISLRWKEERYLCTLNIFFWFCFDFVYIRKLSNLRAYPAGFFEQYLHLFCDCA